MKGCTLSFKTFKYNEAFESGSICFPSQTNRNTDFVMSSGFHADFFWTCFLNSSIGDHIVWDKCFVHCNNVAFVKNQLLLALTDVHHVCYHTVNHIPCIILSSFIFSSKRAHRSSLWFHVKMRGSITVYSLLQHRSNQCYLWSSCLQGSVGCRDWRIAWTCFGLSRRSKRIW